MSMKNPIHPIGNRTGDLPACSPVPQPTAKPRAPDFIFIQKMQTTFINNYLFLIALLPVSMFIQHSQGVCYGKVPQYTYKKLHDDGP
jgi:hypothetical protein